MEVFMGNFAVPNFSFNQPQIDYSPYYRGLSSLGEGIGKGIDKYQKKATEDEILKGKLKANESYIKAYADDFGGAEAVDELLNVSADESPRQRAARLDQTIGNAAVAKKNKDQAQKDLLNQRYLEEQINVMQGNRQRQELQAQQNQEMVQGFNNFAQEAQNVQSGVGVGTVLDPQYVDQVNAMLNKPEVASLVQASQQGVSPTPEMIQQALGSKGQFQPSAMTLNANGQQVPMVMTSPNSAQVVQPPTDNKKSQMSRLYTEYQAALASGDAQHAEYLLNYMNKLSTRADSQDGLADLINQRRTANSSNATPPSTNNAPQQAKIIVSQAEFDALKRGDEFIFNGVKGIKK
jgi:hypothetical protein